MLKKFNLHTLSLIYLCFMTVYMTVREILPLNFLIDSSLVSAAVFAPGLALIVWDLLTTRNCLKGRAQDWLILFFVVCCVSSALNYRYGLFGNIKFIAALAIEILVFFCFAGNTSKEQLQKDLTILSSTLLITWFIPVLASLLMYFFGIDIAVANYGAFAVTSQGFSYEFVRLWGIFQDPNYASMISLVSVLASIRLIALKKRVILSILLVFNILCQLSYLILGGSRAALILTIIIALLFTVYRYMLNGNKTTFKKIAQAAGATLVSFVLCLTVVFGIKAVLPLTKRAIVPTSTSALLPISSMYHTLYSWSDFEFEVIQRNSNGEVIFYTAPGGAAAPTPDDLPPDSTKPLDRTDLGKTDISNGRFTRWLQTLQVFAKSPFFGTSPRNLAEFAKVHAPETLMAKYGMAPHNGYLDVLVETGIIGFGVLATAIFLIVLSFFVRFIKTGFSYDKALLTLSVIAFAGIAFFISDIYTTFSINSMFFWTFLGMAYHWDKEPDKKSGVVLTIYNKTIGGLIDKLFTKKGSL